MNDHAAVAVSVAKAAAVLGVGPGVVRGWLRRGAPRVQAGRRGRGHAELVDPAALAAWRSAGAGDAIVLELARAAPEVLADSFEQTLQRVEGPHKRAVAGALAACWFLGATALLDRLRERCADVPEVQALPEPIERLRKIARG